MHILVTNDDGIEAPGLALLIAALQSRGSVTVVAPEGEFSSCGHGITTKRALSAQRHIFPGLADLAAWKVDGTPADCVRLALLRLLQRPVDLVLAGINAGTNLGKDVYFSGTVAAAREAALNHLPAMAISYDNYRHIRDFGTIEGQLPALLDDLLALPSVPGSFLNVNIPHRPEKRRLALAAAPLSLYHYGNRCETRTGDKGYYLDRDYAGGQDREHDDFRLFRRGYVTVTPVQLDATDYRSLTALTLPIQKGPI